MHHPALSNVALPLSYPLCHNGGMNYGKYANSSHEFTGFSANRPPIPATALTDRLGASAVGPVMDTSQGGYASQAQNHPPCRSGPSPIAKPVQKKSSFGPEIRQILPAPPCGETNFAKSKRFFGFGSSPCGLQTPSPNRFARRAASLRRATAWEKYFTPKA